MVPSLASRTVGSQWQNLTRKWVIPLRFLLTLRKKEVALGGHLSTEGELFERRGYSAAPSLRTYLAIFRAAVAKELGISQATAARKIAKYVRSDGAAE